MCSCPASRSDDTVPVARGTCSRSAAAPTESSSGTAAATSSRKEAGHDCRGHHHQTRVAALGNHRPRFRAARLAELLEGGPDEPQDDVSRTDVARMKRAVDAVLAAAVAVAFVLCVEFFLMR